MGKIKIVFTDIDDTLNPTNEEVSSYTKDVLKKVMNKGIKVVVNTGRGTLYAINKSKEAGLSEYVISSNGSEVYDYKLNKKIFENNIPKETIKGVYDYCESVGLTLILNSFMKRFINKKEYSYNNDPVEYFDDIDEVLENNKINQMIILSTNFERMVVLPRLFEDKFPDLKTVHSSRALTDNKKEKGKEYYHDIVLKNTSKGTGIAELLDYFNIDGSDAMAIGNGYDDLSMLDVVGLGVAVLNANDVLKANAQYVTDSTEDDGVAKALEKYILEES